MAGYDNFKREYRLAAGLGGKKGFEIGHTSASQPIPLHISFSFQKSDLETQNTGKVTVWNLNKAHRSLLEKKNCILSLRAGYGNNISLIFTGIISTSVTTTDGADIKTDIEVVDTLTSIKDTYVSISYKGTVNWKDILNDVAAQMGVAIVFSYNAKFANISNGYTFVGKAKDIISKGCKCCGLTWSLQNGVMQVKRPNDTMSKNVYLLSAETGMVGIPERVVISDDDSKNKMGWDVKYLLNGSINIDDYVKVDSEIVKGYFRVYSLEISGDNVSGDWLCKARLLEVK